MTETATVTIYIVSKFLETGKIYRTQAEIEDGTKNAVIKLSQNRMSWRWIFHGFWYTDEKKARKRAKDMVRNEIKKLQAEIDRLRALDAESEIIDGVPSK